MNATWLDTKMRHIACASITGYQKYISPRKGFACAHRRLHGGESCSQYVKLMVAQKDLAAAIKASRQRFRACREANQILRVRVSNSDPEAPAKPKKSEKNQLNNWLLSNCDCSCCQLATEGINCAIDPFEFSGCELPNCCHCASGIDCSGLDCASCG